VHFLPCLEWEDVMHFSGLSTSKSWIPSIVRGFLRFFSFSSCFRSGRNKMLRHPSIEEVAINPIRHVQMSCLK
jgi:hypothetical protein